MKHVRVSTEANREKCVMTELWDTATPEGLERNQQNRLDIMLREEKEMQKVWC